MHLLLSILWLQACKPPVGDDAPVQADDTDETDVPADTDAPAPSVALRAVTRLVPTQPLPAREGDTVLLGATPERYRLTFGARLDPELAYEAVASLDAAGWTAGFGVDDTTQVTSLGPGGDDEVSFAWFVSATEDAQAAPFSVRLTVDGEEVARADGELALLDPARPRLSRLEDPALGWAPAVEARVGDWLALIGEGFDPSIDDVVVEIGAVAVTEALTDPGDPTRRLLLRVPEGIPGAPAGASDPALPDVPVTLTGTGGGAYDVLSLTVRAPGESAALVVDAPAAGALVGAEVTLTGQGFGVDADRLRVSLGSAGEVTAPLTSVADDAISWTVPAPPGLGGVAGDSVLTVVWVERRDAGGEIERIVPAGVMLISRP